MMAQFSVHLRGSCTPLRHYLPGATTLSYTIIHEQSILGSARKYPAREISGQNRVQSALLKSSCVKIKHIRYSTTNKVELFFGFRENSAMSKALPDTIARREVEYCTVARPFITSAIQYSFQLRSLQQWHGSSRL